MSSESRSPSVSRRQQGFFYGWILLAAATATYFLAGGTRFGAFGVFLKPITQQFGWTRAQASLASSMGSMQGAIEGPVSGYLSDRFGPRIVMFCGFVMVVSGFLMLSVVKNLPLFYFAYVLLISAGFGAVQLPGQSAVGNWFIRKRSRAFAILTSGFALGGFVIVPGIGWLVNNYSWQTASVVIAVVVAMMGFTATFFIRRRPEDYGYLPDGSAPVPLATPRRQAPRPETDFTFKQAVRTRSFWLLGIGIMFTQLATSAVLVHAVSLMTDRDVAPQTAANFFALASFWGLTGRFFWGFLGDTLPKNYLLAMAIVVQATGTMFLAHGGASTFAMLGFTFFYGVGQGSVPVQFAIRGEYFGRKHFATIAGVLQGIATIGGISGPYFAGRMYDLTNTYVTAMTIVAGASLVGCLAFFLAKRPEAPIHRANNGPRG